MNEEEKTLTTITTRIFNQLPIKRFEQTQSQLIFLAEEYIEIYFSMEIEILVSLSITRLESVLRVLLGLLRDISQKVVDKNDERFSSVERSILIVFECMIRCYSHSYKMTEEDLENYEIDNKRKLIPDTLAEQLITLFIQICQEKDHDDYSGMFEEYFGKLISRISHLNYEVAFQHVVKVLESIKKSKENTEVKELDILKYLDYNSKRLSQMFQELAKYLHFFQKSQMEPISISLREAIWNWINTNPSEFTKLSQSEKTMDGNPDILFDHFKRWGGLMKKKSYIFWPIQTMLLILCPDILLGIAKAKKEYLSSPRGEFLETLKKTYRNKGEAPDMAALCFVDLCRASTYVSKEDIAALRYIVPTVLPDLKKKLYSKSKPFRDNNVLVQLLVSSFRINPRDLFDVCLEKDAPPLFRSILLKALLVIAKEEPLPWNPHLSAAYSISTKVKDIFAEYLSNLKSLQINQSGEARTTMISTLVDSSNIKKKEREKFEAAKTHIEVVNETLKLFSQDPEFALCPNNTTPDEITNEISELFMDITSCLESSFSNEITHSATLALKELFKPKIMEKWCPKDVMNSFYDISSTVLFGISHLIIESKEISQEKIQTLLDLIQDLLKKRNEFLISHKREREGYQKEVKKDIVQHHNRTNTKIEQALLILLCNSDPVVCAQAAQCFDSLCEETKMIGDLNNPENTVAVSYNYYKRLVQVGQLTTGKIAQQKGIRSLFRRIDVATNGNKLVWSRIYERWNDQTKIIKYSSKIPDAIETDPQTKKTKQKSKSGDKSFSREFSDSELNRIKIEWSNYTGFLCSLSGVGKSIPETSGPTTVQKSDEKTILGPFIQKLLALIVSPIDFIKETIVPIISTLSPSVYSQFFDQVRDKIAENFSQDGHVSSTNERSTLFYDQLISIIRNILEQPLTLDDLSEIDFEKLILQIVTYLSHIFVDIDSLRIKCKLCQLIEIMMNKRDYLLFRHEIQFRNELVEAIMEWFSVYQKDSTSPNSQQNTNENLTPLTQSQSTNTNQAKDSLDSYTNLNRMKRELDITTMKAIEKLLDGLILQKPWKGEHTKQPTAEQVVEQRSEIFLQYFTFFSSMLQRLQKDKESSEDAKKLSQHTIMSLSNMLHANVNVGLKHALPMGYINDIESRSAFLDVLTNILKQGTEFASLKETAQNKYNELINLLVSDDLFVTKAVCAITQVTDTDLIAKLLVHIHEGESKVMNLLRWAIQDEVKNTPQDQPQMLFRRNSPASKMLGVYSQMIGGAYLQKVLEHLTKSLSNEITINKKTFEINPSMVKEGESKEVNLENLVNFTTQFLDKIIDSISYVPRKLLLISHYLQIYVSQRFPKDVRISVSGFFFLRFLCPAIISPENHNIISERILPEVRRALILIAKTIQNLANGVMFGKKEEFMSPLNTFIEQNQNRFDKFIEDLLKKGKETENQINQEKTSKTKTQTGDLSENLETEQVQITDEQLTEDLESLHHFLNTNMEKLSVHFKRQQDQKNVKIGEKFLSLLNELGKPPEKKNKKEALGVVRETKTITEDFHSENTKKYKKFKDFMKRMESSDTSRLENIFFQKGKTKTGELVFYFITRRTENSEDKGAIIYYILKTFEEFFSKRIQPFVVVIDCSQFSSSHEIPKTWVSQFFSIFPNSWTDNFKEAYMIYPSSGLKKYTKKIGKIISHGFGSKVKIMDSISKLFSIIPESEKELPQETVELETTIKFRFPQIIQVSQFKQREATFNISNQYLQIVQSKESILNTQTNLFDLIHVMDIQEMQLSDEIPDQFMLKMVVNSDQKNLSYRSNSRQEIIQAIQTTKNRIEHQQKLGTNKSGMISAEVRPADVPGSLLNIALLNLGNEFETLRKSAYNLVTSLCRSFNYSLQSQLLETEGLCVPQSHTSFVIDLSKKLAQSEKHLTLEFLRECLKYFRQASLHAKHLCLEYMAPWIPNLKDYVCKYSSINNSDDSNNNKKIQKDNNNIDKKVNTEESNESKRAFAKAVIVDFLEMTIREKTLYPAVLIHVWRTFAGVHDLLDIVIDVFIEQSSKYGVDTPSSDMIAQITVTLASMDSKYVSIKLCDTVLQRISSVSKSLQNQEKTKIEDYEKWDEVLIMTRFLLYLSFENLISLRNTLPELFHIILMIYSSDSLFMRTALLSLVINIIHSLATKLPPQNEQKQLDLRAILNEVTQPRFRVLFMGSGGKKSDIISEGFSAISSGLTGINTTGISGKNLSNIVKKSNKENSNENEQNKSEDSKNNQDEQQEDKTKISGIEPVKKNITRKPLPKLPKKYYKMEKITISSTDQVSHLFREVIECYQNEKQGKDWHKKWLELTTFSAFQTSLIQARAMVVLGNLSEPPIANSFFARIFSYMQPLICKEELLEREIDILTSIIICLTHLYPLLEGSNMKFNMFWVTTCLVQYGETELFPYLIKMLHVILENLDKSGVFDNNDIDEVFMDSRNKNPQLDRLLSDFEEHMGMIFRMGFPVALTSVFLPARKMPTLKNALIGLFQTMVDISCKTGITANKAAYIVSLGSCLTTKEILDLRARLGNYIDWEGELEQLFFNPVMQQEKNTANLQVYLLTSLLIQSDYDQEQLFILDILNYCVDVFPQVFPTVYHLLSLKLFHILSHTQNPHVQKSVLKLTNFMLSDKSRRIPGQLEILGFKNLNKFINSPIDKADKADRGQIISEVLEVVTKV